MNRREAILLVVKVLLQKGYEWLACDADGTIVAYEVKPFKMTEDEWWNYDSEEPKFLTLDNAHDINFVKWEDEEPTNIREWLEKEEEEMIDRRGARYASMDLLLDSGYLWLARDLNGSIAAYSHKPFKLDDAVWYMEIGKSKEMWMWVDDGDLYNFVKWEDDEPVNIREWLKKEEKEMKMYSVKDGELECREVDADFFEKNTTLGGLLTPIDGELDQDNRKESPSNLNANSITTGTLNAPNMCLNPLTDTIQFTNPTTGDKVELDQDNRIVSDGVSIEVNAENSGNSAFYEMAEKFREALDMATEYGYKPSVSIVADNYTWGYNLPILDFKPMYPEQLTLDDLNNVQIHGKVCQELTETYEKKNADYGNSFEISLDKHGLIAAIVRMDDKMNRVTTLNKADEHMVNDESVRDTLMDLANYAIMSVMWLDNKSGEESDGGYIPPTESKAVSFLDQDSYLLAPGAGIIGASDRDIYADNQKIDIEKALREGAHPQAIRDFLGGADYDGDTTNS